MPDIIIYLLKANLAIVLFYLGYRLLLRKLTFYHLNRFYLLFALLFSALYPLVDVQGWFARRQVAAVAEVVYVLPEWDVVPVEQFNPWPYVALLIGAVALVLGIRFLVRLCSLWAIHRQSSPAQWRLFHYRQVFRNVDPFSFWRTIYLNTQQHGQHELEDIFHHEQVHVDELHTLDILLAELFSVLCWFNPGAWLMRHAVRENLEFITDRRVLQSGMDKKAYQYSLLRTSVGQHNPALASNFNLKSIKRRIAMMNTGQSSHVHLGKYVFIIPAIAVFVLVFTITKAQQDRPENEMGELVALTGEIALGEAPDEANANEIPDTIHVNPATEDLTLSVQQAVTDTPVVRILGVGVQRDTSRSAVQVDESTKPKLVIRSISSFQTHFDDSTAVTVNPLIILDGREGDAITLKGLDPNQIESISILKDDGATALYGDKGKHGVILVTTKKGTGRIIGTGAVLDTSVTTTDSVPRIFTRRTVIRDTLKGAPSLEGRFVGAVISGTMMDKLVARRGTEKADEASGDFQDALILIDGKQATSAQLRALSPNDIKQMSILKGEHAIEKYGEKGKNGVIEVELDK